MATTKNLVIDQGATFSANIQFLDTSKNPISLAGYSVRSKMRTSYDTANAAILTANVVNATTGNVNLFLTAANTSLLPQGRYVYDVEAYSGNTVVRIVEGSITVLPGVSGNSTGSILKQTINSLVNGSYSLSLTANGAIVFPSGLIVDRTNAIKPSDTQPLEIRTTNGNAHTVAYQTSNSWEAFSEDTDTGPNYAWAWIKADLSNINSPVVIIENKRASDGNGYRWVFDHTGNIIFPDSTVQSTAFVSNNYISKATLKAIVANSATYAEFQANIAAL